MGGGSFVPIGIPKYGLFYSGNPFGVGHLQNGLINSGEQCYVNSLLLMLHRIGFKDCLIDPGHGGDRVFAMLRLVQSFIVRLL